MDYIVIVQARTGSTRLPGKMISNFVLNKSLLEVVLDRIISVVPLNNIIVATSINESDNAIENIVDSLGMRCFRGSEENVLERFIQAAEHFQAKNIIRVCADNPFLSKLDLKVIINEIVINDYDYVSFKFSDGKPSIKSHIGLYAEAIKLEALKRVLEMNVDKFYTEHVTNYIYENNDRFNIKLIDIPENVQKQINVRLTIDTIDDFNLLKDLYQKVGNYSSFTELFDCINSNQEYLNIMKNQIVKNIK